MYVGVSVGITFIRTYVRTYVRTYEVTEQDNCPSDGNTGCIIKSPMLVNIAPTYLIKHKYVYFNN